MGANQSNDPPVLDIRQIAKILPHRYPFLLVDRIIELDLENTRIVGIKNVTTNEHFFQGHFPEVPIMPGVLILEALAQTGGILVEQKSRTEKTALLLNVNNAKFRKPVVPGDVLVLDVEGIHISSKGGKILAKALVDGALAVQAEIGFALLQKDQL